MNKPLLQVAKDGLYEMVIEGVISSEQWFGDEFTPDMVREEIAKANGSPIRIVINSPGGEVFAGTAIYNALLQYDGRKVVRVDGVAASMASVIAMVGDEIIMSPGSTMMVHRPLVGAMGNVNDLQAAIEMLEAIEETIIPIYQERTGLSKDEVFALLDKETWMSADKAVELGFADKLEEKPKAKALDKIMAMLDNQQFAYSMNAVHKSLADYVKAEAPEEEAKVEEVKTETPEVAEVETVETVEAEAVVETTETEEVVAEEAEVVEAEVEEAETDEQEATEPVASETKEEVEEKVEMSKETATDAVVEMANPVASTAATPVNKNAIRENFAAQMTALVAGDAGAQVRLAKAGAEAAQMAIADGSPLYVDEVVRQDILKAYTVAGRVGGLVDRESIVADTLKILVETAGVGFQAVALGAIKATDTPVWVPKTFEPFEWALIVPWKDGDQKRTSINIYNQIIQYIANEYAKLEDKIILTYAGGTVGAETRPASGLVPILTAAGRTTSVSSYDSDDVVRALGVAYGKIESDGVITLVANRKTWGGLAVSVDAEGRPLFTVVGEQVAAGALGTFNVVLSNALADGDVVVGNFADYLLVTRGALATLFSQEAVVPTGESTSINLFAQDASALRADIDITGGAKRVQSFQLLEFPVNS